MLGYMEGRTFFHRIDPISKFGWLSLVSIWLLSLQDLRSVVLWCGGLLVIVIIGAGVNPLKHLHTLALVLLGGVGLVLFQGLFREGTGIELAWFHFSYSGLKLGAVLTIRTLGIICCSLAYSRTTDPKLVALSLVKLGMPYKYAHVAFLGLRFIPILEADLRIINDAQKLRGVKGVLRKIKLTTIALVATEIRRTEEIAIALETRAFSLHPRRTNLEEVTYSSKGVLMIIITVVLIVVHLWVTWPSVL